MNDDRADPGLMSRYDIRSLLTVPLVAADEVIGILTFHMRSSAKQFDADGREFATRLAVALALAIENARLYASQREIADTLQNAMLFFPEDLPGVDLGHAYRSADELALIGGDFYAAFELADGRVGLVLGDVSGKGIAAATASSMVRTTLHAFSLGGARPAEVFAATNRALLELLPDGVFATATYAEIDTGTGTAVLCSAGHPDPFVCTAGGCVRYDARRNRPLGLFDDSTYEEFTVTLNRGDSLVLFSDGLPDARRDKEFFGDERIVTVLDGMRAAGPQLIVDTLMAAVAAFAGRQHTDDIAIVAATIRSA
jgi:sigma-B regulation protein RsbU (phosphoserine phosphatase)